jgi:hypothetical protein
VVSVSGFLGRMMAKRVYGWILGIGLLLGAVGFLTIGTSRHPQQRLPYRLAVGQAVVDLSDKTGGCLLCHSTLSAPSPVAFHHTLPVETLSSRLDTRLAEAGTRILDLPAADSPSYDNIVHDFLRVYAQTRTSSTPADVIRGYMAVNRLMVALNLLERQSSPDHWSSSPAVPVRERVAAVQTLLVPVPAAEHTALVLSRGVVPPPLRLDRDQTVLVLHVVSVSHRCDPPMSGFFPLRWI